MPISQPTLAAAFIKTAVDLFHPDSGGTKLLGIGSILLGVLLMIVYNIVAPPYFRGQTLERAGSDHDRAGP